MKTSKTFLGLITLITLIAINSLAANVSAQIIKPTPRCSATVSQIYFVDSGQSVTEVRPGSNGGNGYQLNILGSNVNKFEVVQEKYMTTLYVIPGYTNATAAKWAVFFAANMGQVISSIKLKNNCKAGRDQISVYQLTESVRLLDQ